MKNALIFHGTDCKPEDFWYPWLATELNARGYKVSVPSYPDINHTDIGEFLPKVLAAHTINEETVLIGHSAGATLLLSILEKLDIVVPQALLVAGFCAQLEKGVVEPIIQEHYDWDAIKRHVKDIYFINSINDPWGCNDLQGRMMFDQLGGTQIIRNDGHFGSANIKQAYPAFRLLNQLIL